MIPKKIFSYWEGPRPEIVNFCLWQIRETNPSCQFVCLGRHDVPEIDGVSSLSPQHRSDVVRIHTLSIHGGVWMDASCMDCLPVETWVDFSAHKVQGFYMGDDVKQIENWAFASPANFPLTLRWAAELLYAVRIGFGNYKQLRRRYIPQSTLLWMPYLTMHGAWCVARYNGNDADVTLRSSVTGRGPYRYLAENGWSSKAAVRNLELYRRRLYFIKLRGDERDAMIHQGPRWEWVLFATVGFMLVIAAMSLPVSQQKKFHILT